MVKSVVYTVLLHVTNLTIRACAYQVHFVSAGRGHELVLSGRDLSRAVLLSIYCCYSTLQETFPGSSAFLRCVWFLFALETLAKTMEQYGILALAAAFNTVIAIQPKLCSTESALSTAVNPELHRICKGNKSSR